ncbi:hypothetical protein BD779DRAFT_1662606 [Infundibulicybe gibba]|nr:hypothetical protein BD779DRAFT_1662606 [Infundibulicybe gibba]
MADSARARPRPRPKPKAKISTKTVSENSQPLPLSSLPPSSPTQDALDAMFTRNRTHTAKTWQKIVEITKEPEPQLNQDDSESEADSPRRKPRRKPDQRDAPRWQTSQAMVRLLSEGVSDDSDADSITIIEAPTQSSKKAGKRKRPQRSRSRSITPPPALPFHQIQNARNVVRTTLGSICRPISPTQFEGDDSTDTIILDEELAQIVRSVQSQSRSQPHIPSDEIKDNDTLNVSVKWKPHPLNKAGKEHIWVFKINRDDNFRELFEATAEEASILTQNLIMLYDGKRVFPSVTPKTLRIYGDAELGSVACEATAYDYMRSNDLVHASSNSLEDTNASSDTEVPEIPLQSQESDAESEADGDKLKLILRSALTEKDITLTVRPTTKCGAIVKAFLKKAGLAANYPNLFEPDSPSAAKKQKNGKSGKEPKISVDGDSMDNNVEIGEADLEDGDLVEVVGL